MVEVGSDEVFLLWTVLPFFLVAGRVCLTFIVDVLAFLAHGFLSGGMLDIKKNIIFVQSEL